MLQSLPTKSTLNANGCTTCHPTNPLIPICFHATRSSAVHGVLASLPKMTPDALQRFGQQLLGTGSEKTQRDITKKMLVSLGQERVLQGVLCWPRQQEDAALLAKSMLVNVEAFVPLLGQERVVQGVLC